MLSTALLFVALFYPVQAQGPVRVWATIADAEIPVGQTTVLELNIETRGPGPDAITLPTLPPELEVVGTSDQSQLQFTVPGGRTRSVRRQIVLRPLAPGTFRIPPITVRVQGTRYRTQALSISVTSTTSGGSRGSGGWGGIGGTAGDPDEGVIFVARTAPDTVYVGQQVTLHADVLISDETRVRLRRAPEYHPPDAPGFWIQDLPTPARGRSRTVGGRYYEGQSFLRAYFPLAPGRYTLPPARLTYELRRGFLYSPDDQELQSDSLRIVVLPLPDAGRPVEFTGAVGRFAVRARLEPEEVPAGEAAALVVEVEGEGDIRSLPPPRIPELSGVDVYPPTEDAEVHTDGGVVNGVKRFTWILVPQRAGAVEVPSIGYGYFDPARQRYDVARASVPELRVRGGGGAPNADRPPAILDLKDSPSGSSSLRWVRSPVFLGLQFLPVLAVIGILLRRRRRGRPRATSRRELRRRRLRALASLRSRLGGTDPVFFDELARFIRDSIADRLDDPALRRADGAALAAALERHGVSPTIRNVLPRLLERVDRARYEPAPPGAGTRRALLDEADRLLDALDREARGHRMRGRVPVAGVSLVLLGIFVSPVWAPAAEIQEFQRGLELYRAGDHARAARAFAAYLAAHPEDAAAWYNLGNANFESGERGRAIWAWIRALRLAPRDPAPVHNLEVARADPRLVRKATPPIPLTTDETLLAACLIWLFGSSAIAWSVLRRDRNAGLAGGAGVVIAIALLAGWGAPRFRTEIAVVLPERAALRAAPGARTEELRTVNAGDGLMVLELRGEWLRVEGPEGSEGWIEAGGVGLVRRGAGP